MIKGILSWELACRLQDVANGLNTIEQLSKHNGDVKIDTLYHQMSRLRNKGVILARRCPNWKRAYGAGGHPHIYSLTERGKAELSAWYNLVEAFLEGKKHEC